MRYNADVASKQARTGGTLVDRAFAPYATAVPMDNSLHGGKPDAGAFECSL